MAFTGTLLLPGCISYDADFGGNAVHQTVHERFAVAPNARVRVSNVSGSITIVPWSRQAIDVVGRKYAGTIAALRRMTVSIVRDGSPASYVEIETQYPRHVFFFWGNNSGGSVDYTIHVPKRVRLTLADVSGDVRVSGIDGDVEVKNVSGDVDVARLNGDLDIHTVSGSIDASLVAMNGDRRVTIEAISGSIQIAVPAKSSAEVSAESISGSFESAFNIPTHRQTVGVNASGRIGNGSGTIDLKTISGSMMISKT